MSRDFVIKRSPPPIVKARKPSGRPMKYPFATMKVGEAFQIPRSAAQTAYNSALRFEKRNPGYKFKQGDDPKKEDVVWVHRVPAPEESGPVVL